MSTTTISSLNVRIDEVLDALTEVDVPALARQLGEGLSDEERDGLVFTGLVRKIENRIREGRCAALAPQVGRPASTRSAKWEAVAAAVSSGALAVLQAKVSVGGLQRAIGTLTKLECAEVCAGYQESALKLDDRAKRFAKLTNAMSKHKAETVADLDHALIEGIFHA